MSLELEIKGQNAVALTNQLQAGLILDRVQTRKLLRELEKLDVFVAGCSVMQSQLGNILDRRDWITISVSAESPTSARLTGVTIGIVQAKVSNQPKRLSPMQKMQRKNGLRTNWS